MKKLANDEIQNISGGRCLCLIANAVGANINTHTFEKDGISNKYECAYLCCTDRKYQLWLFYHDDENVNEQKWESCPGTDLKQN